MTKHRWAWAEIDLAAIAHNVRAISGLCGPDVRFMAVVKADGYGHGAFEVGRAALAAGASHLGVATVDEALHLRRKGITAPILLLAEPPITSIPEILNESIMPAVTTAEFLLEYGGIAAARGEVAPYHLKIDTGMNRIGVHHLDAPGFAASFAFLPGARLDGTFTHFATADTPGDWGFDQQLERFNAAIAAMRAEGVDPGIVHAANSAAALLHPKARFDMVRVGIALYGLHPADASRDVVDLSPAMSIKARLTLVKEVPLGEGIGYGLTHQAGRGSRVGTMPIGYADGLRRILSNRMDVLHDGRRLPQVGRICMDQTMIEHTIQRRPGVEPESSIEMGDEIVIIGRQGSESISADEHAALANTISYEVTCGFGARLERVFLVGEIV